MAFEAGAEKEDIPEIIAGALETASKLTTAFVDSLAELDKAHAFKKGKTR